MWKINFDILSSSKHACQQTYIPSTCVKRHHIPYRIPRGDWILCQILTFIAGRFCYNSGQEEPLRLESGLVFAVQYGKKINEA